MLRTHVELIESSLHCNVIGWGAGILRGFKFEAKDSGRFDLRADNYSVSECKGSSVRTRDPVRHIFVNPVSEQSHRECWFL